MINKIWKIGYHRQWLQRTFGSSLLARLSTPECSLRNQGQSTAGPRSNPPSRPHRSAHRKETFRSQGVQCSNHVCTERQETQQPLQSLTFGKYSEPLTGLSITTRSAGTTPTCLHWGSTCLGWRIWTRNCPCQQAGTSTNTLSLEKSGVELKAIGSEVSGYKAVFFGASFWWWKVLDLVSFTEPQNNW